MKRFILAFFVPFLFVANSEASNSTIDIDLDKIPDEAVQKIKPESKSLIKSELDLTNVVVFVKEWKNNESRKTELLNLYSSVIPKAFKKYPGSKQFEFSTYVSYKNKLSDKNETRYLSKMVVTKDDSNKIDWKKFKNNDPQSKKLFKVLNFSGL